MKSKFRTIGVAIGALAAAVAFMAMVASASADAPVYVLNNWPSEIDTIPCSSWQKSADGTWVLNGTIKIGASDLANVGVKGDAAARIVERLCGAKSK
jgi:hypothetical protein